MKASELIAMLQAGIEKRGDLEVVADCDHDPVEGLRYEEDSWIFDHRPAFELSPWHEIDF